MFYSIIISVIILLNGIFNYNNFYKIKPLFDDIRFYMVNNVLDGLMRETYVDNVLNPQTAF